MTASPPPRRDPGSPRAPLLALASLCVALLAIAAAPAAAQDTTRGVRIGLTYQPGTRPGVAVLPVAGPHGDSIRAMLERDLDFGDRVDVVARAGTAVADAAKQQALAGVVNYALWKTLGAAAVIQASETPLGLQVVLHDVVKAKALDAQIFALPAAALGAEWRMAVHGASDGIEQWVTGTRGIAQTRVLYVRGKQVYVTDSDGAGARAVSTGATALSPSWSPDGRTIAYSQFSTHGTEIMIADVETGAARPLGVARGGLNITPDWSPNGRELVFAHGQENGTDLYIADATGAGMMRRVTVGQGTDNTSPSFSPDGRRIAYTSGKSGHPEIYVTDADGANAELLTTYTYGETSYRASPSWSPDGRTIAYQTRIAGRFQVALIRLRDRSMKQLTSEGENEDPSWAPDGRHLVFTSSRSGSKQLWVLDTETGRVRQLTHGGVARLAAWSRPLGGAP